ncbi:hypothetical protein NMG60_11035082 [Bertholletia excelsa]
MQSKKSIVAHRAWNILRLALLWARKGGVFKRRLTMDLCLFPKFLKSLAHSSDRGAIPYGERELSFEKTPIIHVKMNRPSSSMRFRIPCLNPQVDFDYDLDFNDGGDALSYCNESARRSFLTYGDEDDRSECEVCEEAVNGDEGIDLKAEEFIAKFYQQIKLQRQISYLQYNEMLSKGAA